MPTITNSPVYWAGATRMPAPRGFLHEELAEKLNDAVSASRGSSRGVSRVDSINQYKASKWLIEALYQGY